MSRAWLTSDEGYLDMQKLLTGSPAPAACEMHLLPSMELGRHWPWSQPSPGESRLHQPAAAERLHMFPGKRQVLY